MDLDQQDFQNLRRLLALKRHEQPPPGYFESFSRQVILRIQAGDSDTGNTGWAAWFKGLLDTFETRPALAGAFGFAVCAFLATGFFYNEPPPANTVIANSAVFEVPYEKVSFARTSETNGVLHREFQRTSLFEEMKQQSLPRLQLINWQ